jgi:hypothetical protein
MILIVKYIHGSMDNDIYSQLDNKYGMLTIDDVENGADCYHTSEVLTTGVKLDGSGDHDGVGSSYAETMIAPPLGNFVPQSGIRKPPESIKPQKSSGCKLPTVSSAPAGRIALTTLCGGKLSRLNTRQDTH